MKRTMWFRSIVFIGLAVLTACSAIPGKNLKQQYIKMVRVVGLTPVYPPREELQVGDVFVRSYNRENQDDVDTLALVWVGTLNGMRHAANDYLRSRINFTDTGLDGTGDNKKLSFSQSDFTAGVVTLNDGSRKTLPLVNLPTISGAASTAGALGGYGFLQSFNIALGRSENVSIDFVDTRAYGVPLGAATTKYKYEHELRSKICRHFDTAINRAGLIAETFGVSRQNVCTGNRKCDVAVVTRTYLTRQIDYTYASARVARLAASQIRNPATPPTTTVPANNNLGVTVHLGEDADGSKLDELVKALSTKVDASSKNVESTGLQFVGVQANSLKFSRELIKPVAVGYDSINFSFKKIRGLCSGK